MLGEVSLAAPETDVSSKGRRPPFPLSPTPTHISSGLATMSLSLGALQRKENQHSTMTIGPLSPTHPPPILPSLKTFHSSIEKLRTNASLYPHHEEAEEPADADSNTEYPFNMDATWMTAGETDSFLPRSTSKGEHLSLEWGGCRRPAVRGRVLSTRWTHSPEFYDCESHLGYYNRKHFQRRLLAGAYFGMLFFTLVGICLVLQGLTQ